MQDRLGGNVCVQRNGRKLDSGGIFLLVGMLVLGAFFGEMLGGNVLHFMGAGLAVVLGGLAQSLV